MDKDKLKEIILEELKKDTSPADVQLYKKSLAKNTAAQAVQGKIDTAPESLQAIMYQINNLTSKLSEQDKKRVLSLLIQKIRGM